MLLIFHVGFDKQLNFYPCYFFYINKMSFQLMVHLEAFNEIKRTFLLKKKTVLITIKIILHYVVFHQK